MTPEPLERIAALAPRPSVDPDGLAAAFAAFERGLRTTPEVAGRRRRSTKTRHVRRVALAGAVAVALTGGAIVLPPHLHAFWPGSRTAGDPFAPTGPLSSGLLPAAAAADGRCASPVVEDMDAVKVPREAWATSPISSALGLLDVDVAPDYVGAYESPRRCPTAVANAVVYDSSRTTGVNVYRDVAADDELRGIETDDHAVRFSVRGASASALSWKNGDRPRQRITWVDDTGIRWFAVADGLPQATTVRLLDALRFDDGGALETSSVPKGYRSAPTTDPAVGTKPSYQWEVQYDGGGSTSVTQGTGMYEVPSPKYRYLSVTTPAIEPIEARIASRGNALVDFDGTLAAWSPSGEGGARLTWIQDGAVYQLAAPVKSLDAMLALARTVEHVHADDPRLH
ncbi:hypothetical protein ACFT5B_00465 [Luteimicrobium sp. NPDC057192]|uniref:hypothetical protein n=1 Tax=Luteimicrobium sp. NPDC057192 TaxID=3346042 RepID=UPI0036450F5C